MKPHELALLYMQKAAEDEALLDEIIDSDRVSHEIFGFHCQQAAEKLLKAILASKGIRFRKTHDLRELTDLLSDNGEPIPANLNDLDRLTPYGTILRYDILDDDVIFDRQSAIEMVRSLRAWVRQKIG